MNMMQQSGAFESGEHWLFSQDLAGRISFEDLTSNDRIIIETANSVYRFIVTETESRQGRLTGGALGLRQVNASLIESRSETSEGTINDLSGLRIGSRALIYIETNAGIERLVTSAIIGLTLVRSKEDDTPVA